MKGFGWISHVVEIDVMPSWRVTLINRAFFKNNLIYYGLFSMYVQMDFGGHQKRYKEIIWR